MKDEFSLEAKIYDKIWGTHDYDADVSFLDELFREHNCKSVIDIGCGTGNHAVRLSKLGYEVTGIDVSPAMLQKAKEKDKHARVRFMQGNVQKLETVVPKGERFDAAICVGVVFSHFLTNKVVRGFFNSLHTVVRRNGLFIFDVRNAKKISEDYLNRLLLDHIITEDKLQLLLLTYNTRDLRNRNIIVWRPICLMNENGKVDLQIREHKLRWFQLSALKKLLIENQFELLAQYSGPTREEFKEDEHTTAWFIARAK
jgi:2-polyprenyl-3-methyl-5-hydroxy-6-metoxy-1,4-benzoquinol methylase